jgi:hypothetical protein
VNNKKCPNCGFINFLQAESCRKCETTLDATGAPQQPHGATGMPEHEPGMSYSNPYRPPSTKNGGGFPIFKVLLGAGALIVVSLVIVVVLGATFLMKSRALAWREFHPGEPGITVMMPNEPTVVDPIVTPTQYGDMKHYMYTSLVPRQGMAAFTIVVFPFNFSTYEIPSDKLLEKEMDSFLKRTDATLISKSSTNESGLSGLSFEFKPKASRASRVERGFGKMLLGTNRLYVLALVADEKSELLKGKDKFLNASIPY